MVLQQVQKWALENAGTITGSVLGAGIALFAGLTGAFIVLILTIYFTAATPALKRSVYQLVPASKRPRFIDLGEQITDSVGYYVIGQLSLGVINGILSAIFLTIIGAPFPAVLAVVAFFFSLIPLVGTLTGSTLIVLACFIPPGSPTTALIAGIYYLIYMQIEAYVISPRIMNRAVSVPGAVVVIAALAGGSLLGPARRADRDPGRREHPDHLPAGGHPAAERALTGRRSPSRRGRSLRMTRTTRATPPGAAGHPG